MPGNKKKNTEKENAIPPKIVEAISSIIPEDLTINESCPSFTIKKLNINESSENLKKKKIEKEYKIGNYLIKKTLGQGTFGKVKLGIYLPNKEKVAIKILEKSRIIEKDDEIRVKREFDMLALFNHPNVILVAEIFESFDSYYSVMEYCQGGELFNYIVKNRRLSDDEAAFFYFQLINGLEYLHSLGIVHRDLKPENLLLTNEHLLKIIDFGLSNYFHEGQKNLLSTPCGSPCYASPEMVAGKKYNGFKIDIWSTGIILYAMLCGYLPFEDKDNEVLFEKILECKLVFPKYISKNAKDLIKKILVTDPNKRITIPEIKKHPFYLNGKELFEQDFSIYQITKDNNENNSSYNHIDLNQILDTPELKENVELSYIENKENIENNKDKNDTNKERKIKEIEIKLDNKIIEKIDEANNNTDNKDNIEDYNVHKKIKTYELETNTHTIEFENIGKNSSKDSKKERITRINTSKSREKKEKVKKLSLLKEPNNKETKRLIKNARKLNIKNGSQRNKKGKKLNDIINHNNLKLHLLQGKRHDILSNLKTEKFLDKNVINKRVKLTRKKFDSKNDLNNQINFDTNNILLNKINNNTIDNGDMNTKKKLKMNFQKLNFTSVRKDKKAKSNSKNYGKLNLFNPTKLRKPSNNKNAIYKINTTTKKTNSKKFNLSSNIQRGNWSIIKYNLLHRKNLKEININLKKAKKMILFNEENNQKKSVDKKNINNNKMPDNNSNTIDTILNNNNMNIIENLEKKVPEKNKNTLIKLNKKMISKKQTLKTEKIRKEKLFMNVIGKGRLSHQINKTSNNLNAYLQNIVTKKTIDIDDIKDNYKKGNNILTNFNGLKLKKISINKKPMKKELNNLNIENNNKKNNLANLIDKSDNLEPIANILKTEPNQNKFMKLLNPINNPIKKNINEINNNYPKDNKNGLFQVKSPLNNPNKKSKLNYIKKKQSDTLINENKIPKHLNRTSNSNFNSFIQNPFTVNNQNSNNKLLIHEKNGSFNQSEHNLINKLNDKNALNNLNNIGKKKPLVSIRNTVINFNMIDSGLILDSLKRKKNVKKTSNSNFVPNNSVNKLQNNHLFNLCNKFNNNFNFNNHLMLNHEYHSNKTKTINTQGNINKVFKYGEKMNNKFKTKNYLNNYVRSHIKYKSMRLEDYYGLKKKKNLKNINTNKIENGINNNKFMDIDLKHFNTVND